MKRMYSKNEIEEAVNESELAERVKDLEEAGTGTKLYKHDLTLRNPINVACLAFRGDTKVFESYDLAVSNCSIVSTIDKPFYQSGGMNNNNILYGLINGNICSLSYTPGPGVQFKLNWLPYYEGHQMYLTGQQYLLTGGYTDVVTPL